MGQLFSCAAMGATWCVGSACGSVLNSCCGTDKPSTVAPGANSGRRRSVLLMVISMIISFIFQYWVAGAVVSPNQGGSQFSASQIAKDQATNFIKGNWLDGCDQYSSQGLRERCVGNNGVYRAAGSATLFFLLAAIVVTMKPSFNREVWPSKYLLFLVLCAVTIFIPNDPLFSKIYMNIARIGGVVFIIVQQVIFLDLAHNLNDSWVAKADAAEAEEAGSGKKWLAAILIACAVLFTGSIIVIGLMFHFFGGCTINTTFVAVTLILCVLVTGIQLTGDEASLLSSATTTAYATYLCFSSLSRNPNGECNPKLGEDDIVGIILGIGLTMVSLSWTGWSYTAGETMNAREENTDDSSPTDQQSNQRKYKKDEDRNVQGIVTGGAYRTNESGSDAEDPRASPENEGSTDETNNGFSNSWKLNIVLALISCWFAMVVTSWGSIDNGGDRANPEVGRVSMWMLIASQWLFIALYLWTLTAPRLFPNRDFS